MSDGAEMGSDAGPTMGDPAISVFDYDVVNGTTQDMNKLELSLLYLQQNSDFAAQLLDQGRGFSIEFWSQFDATATLDGYGNSLINWNPDIANGTSSGGWQSAASVLAAEFAHLVLPDGMSTAPGSFLWNGELAEQIAHTAANTILGQLGEPLRLGYADESLFVINDPSSFNDWGFGSLNAISEAFQVIDTAGYLAAMDFDGAIRSELMGSDFGNTSLSMFDDHDWGSWSFDIGGGGGGDWSDALNYVFDLINVEIANKLG